MIDATTCAWGDEQLIALRESLVCEMSPKRYAHTCAVERMAIRLGQLYCPEKIPELRAAALLHDITKEESLQKQLQMCAEFGIMIKSGDLLSPKTFHAKTAAALIASDARYAPYATSTVVSAVRWHTTGHADMTLTEQLIYLSDYIDDSRTFSDCVRLRDAFWGADVASMTPEDRLKHLRQIMILAYDMTFAILMEEGAPISIDTLLARNDLIEQCAKT